MPDIMLDLETLGTTPGCVIRSIGAVAFDPNGGPMGETLYLIIDRASCEAAGLTVDPDTEAWWAAQSPEARSEFDGQGMSLAEALDVFDLFYETLAPIDAKADRLWCNGPSFDESILAAAYRALGRKTPWRYNAARDCRTIYDLAGLKLQHTGGTFHKAIDDAVEQAKLVQESIRKIRLGLPVWREIDDVAKAGKPVLAWTIPPGQMPAIHYGTISVLQFDEVEGGGGWGNEFGELVEPPSLYIPFERPPADLVGRVVEAARLEQAVATSGSEA